MDYVWIAALGSKDGSAQDLNIKGLIIQAV
jgi:hypothetical protein